MCNVQPRNSSTSTQKSERTNERISERKIRKHMRFYEVTLTVIFLCSENRKKETRREKVFEIQEKNSITTYRVIKQENRSERSRMENVIMSVRTNVTVYSLVAVIYDICKNKKNT